MWLRLNRAPGAYAAVSEPLEAGMPHEHSGGGLDGFDSPYLGHTGSWNGHGGPWLGKSKEPDLEKETEIGLRWTFMPVYWSSLEPDGPVDLTQSLPPNWSELDAFVVAAHKHGLNILMQAPVFGGNAGGPPRWAGRKAAGASAPADLDGAVSFLAKLALRYAPGGTLAVSQGWGTNYGVRAWEMDNEPESYRTHWKGQAAVYADFVFRAAQRLKEIDPFALIAAPAIAGGGGGLTWTEAALEAGHPTEIGQTNRWSLGAAIDIISFHCYEGLESAFSSTPRSIETDLHEIRALFEKYDGGTGGVGYPRKTEYWHTEGNYDFIGVLSQQRRAAWRWQFFSRGFAAGIRKLCVMDASPPERTAVHTYIRLLPNPFPMVPAVKEISVSRGQISAFRHQEDSPHRTVWVLWALAGTGDASVRLPVRTASARLFFLDGHEEAGSVVNGACALELKGDSKMAPPVIAVAE